MKPETAKRTALEWLEYEFVKLESTVGVHSSMYHLIEKAMIMEKEQIFEAYGNGYEAGFTSGDFVPEQYYNETFKTNEK
jgi:hypothetical protein